MTSVALTLGLLLGFLVALLAVPLTVEFSVHLLDEIRAVIRFRWLFGVVRFRLRIPRPAKTRTPPHPAPAAKAASPATKRRGRAGRLLPLVLEPALRRRVHRFIRDMLRATHAQDLLLRLRIGLGDPADTGRLWAVVGPVAGAARSLRNAVVRIEPEFIDPVFEVESHGQCRLVPIQFIAVTAAFLASPTMLRVWWRLFRGGA